MEMEPEDQPLRVITKIFASFYRMLREEKLPRWVAIRGAEFFISELFIKQLLHGDTSSSKNERATDVLLNILKNTPPYGGKM